MDWWRLLEAVYLGASLAYAIDFYMDGDIDLPHKIEDLTWSKFERIKRRIKKTLRTVKRYVIVAVLFIPLVIACIWMAYEEGYK